MLTSRLFTAAAACAAIIGCAGQPAAVKGQPALLVGAQASGARVLIKSVDDGPTLWAQPGALGSRVTINPGHHKVAVMCELGTHFVDAVVTLDVRPGQTYDLTGAPAEGTNGCNVTALGHG